MNNKRKLIVIVSTVIVIILAAGAVVMLSSSGNSNTDASGTNNNEAASEEFLFSGKELPEIVAVINGQEIYKEQLLRDYMQMKTLYENAGIDTGNPDMQKLMQEMLIMDMINTVILVQEAEKAGINIDDDTVNKEKEIIVSQFESEEDFKNMLEKLDITLDDFNEKIRRQLKINTYLKAKVEESLANNDSLNISEEEKEEMYGIIESQLGDLPGYEDMKPKFDMMLENSKAQVIIGELIKDLLEKSEIELFIETKS